MTIFGTQDDDDLSGTAGADIFDMTQGGVDRVLGLGGADRFLFGDAFTRRDTVDGGLDTDTLVLDGEYSGGVQFRAHTIERVETIELTAGHSYALTIHEGNVGNGAILKISAVGLGAGDAFAFDGSAETTGGFDVKSGAANDTLIGGAGSDRLLGKAGHDVIAGGLGADTLSGGLDDDIYVMNGVADSTGVARDMIASFNTHIDAFDLSVAVTGVDERLNSGTLSEATFDADLEAAIVAGRLAVGHAVRFKPSSGDYDGIEFIIVDANGTAGYQAGEDFVLEIGMSSHLKFLSVANFI